MLDILHEVEMQMPYLLDQPGWNSLDVDYHNPRVERIWRQWGDYRISLHVIHYCPDDTSLFHPHPWPSAMRVWSGIYEMKVGWGEGLNPPPVACKMEYRGDCLPGGFEYEMTDPNGWHSVRPTADCCYTIMVSGKPWKRETEGSSKPLNPLTPDRIAEIMERYRSFYKPL